MGDTQLSVGLFSNVGSRADGRATVVINTNLKVR